MFKDAHTYADHLRTLISDESLVLEAVRLRYPSYDPAKKTKPQPPQPAPPQKRPDARRMSYEEFAGRSRSKPTSRFDGYLVTDAQDRATTARIKQGSRSLLTALWVSHPRIMENLGAAQP